MRRIFAIACCVALLISANVPLAAAYTDGDSDKVEDERDNCQGSANPYQFDIDADGEGDVCERPIPMSDEFDGTPSSDLMFGSYRDSKLRGGAGPDALYGQGGDDFIDGGSGRDLLVGGPGVDVVAGGPGCDVFGIDIAIDQWDIITDFTPGVDRVRFPPQRRQLNRLPAASPGGTDTLEVRFEVAGLPDATVVFVGFRPGARLVLSTEPCGSSPPPSSICPVVGAWRTMIFLGFDDLFCPGRGALRSGIGVYSPPQRKLLGDRLTKDS